MTAGRTAPAWAVAGAAMFSCAWGGNQFTPLLTMYRQVNGYSAVVVDALLGAYVLGLAPALLAGGPLSDRRGRRPVMLAGLLSSGLGSTALAVGTLPFLAAGRLLSGVAVGLGMAVGTSWLTELTVAGGRSPATGARRASLALTAGFGVGAGVAGVLAQWGPQPETVPYLVHLAVLVVVVAAVARRNEETRAGHAASTRPAPGLRMATAAHLDDDTRAGDAASTRPAPGLRMVSLRHPRFRRLVLPMAPWVFGAAGVAYAILPQAMSVRVGHWALIYATALTVVTLGAGVVIQPVARRLDHAHRPRAILVAMAAVTAGVGAAAAAVELDSAWGAALAALMLGGAYGLALVAGLVEVQRISAPGEQAALTGVYYALSYVGFLLPTALAAGARWIPTGPELAILTVVALASTLLVLAGRTVPVAPPHDGPGRAGRELAAAGSR